MPRINDDYTLIITVNESILDYQEIKVLIRKPSSVVFDEKEPTSVDVNENKITLNVESAYNDLAGEWLFRVRVVNSESLTATSEIRSIIIDE